MKQASLPLFEIQNYNEVYVPDEDTFLLMDSILNFPPSIQPTRCIEIGCGYGCVAIQMAKQFQIIPYCTDINPLALQNAQNTFIVNNLQGEFIQSDLFQNVDGKFDIIAFNPPYVPGDLQCDNLLDLALCGGAHGRDVIDRFLQELPARCSPGATVYMVAIEANAPDQLLAVLATRGFTAAVVLRKRLQSEALVVIRAVRE
ncbi:Glutamine methyltransferase [Spironucleus salmonicida]|uniref:DNA methyltransferase n=1 Tax=Spironucleus salmonicida TaxID=348837 RepID=V6LCK0_9EUKA|nr:Glutamine methyltransferase [Spironucleus salmonicida]|eukprot:EST42205.1 DNA methyltransferase [Spironucleus salmonicida]